MLIFGNWRRRADPAVVSLAKIGGISWPSMVESSRLPEAVRFEWLHGISCGQCSFCDMVAFVIACIA